MGSHRVGHDGSDLAAAVTFIHSPLQWLMQRGNNNEHYVYSESRSKDMFKYSLKNSDRWHAFTWGIETKASYSILNVWEVSTQYPCQSTAGKSYSR